MSNIPNDLKFTKDHEWIKVLEEGVVLVGITDYAQSELGEIVYIEVDTIGESLDKEEVFGTIEAVKTTSDLFMPLAGEILEFNQELSEDDGDNPALINEDPYDKAWIVKIAVSNPSDLDGLLSAEEYTKLIS